MLKNILIIAFGLLIGAGVAFGLYTYRPEIFQQGSEAIISPITFLLPVKKEIIGYLPYWLLSKETGDFTKYITMLDYFGLRIDTDGSVLKRTNPQETEPGWLALQSGKFDSFFEKAKNARTQLSLSVVSGDNDAIAKLISEPEAHAKALTDEVLPIMKQYGFTNLNLDIEFVGVASDSARANLTTFVAAVKREMRTDRSLTLSADLTADSFIKHNLIDPDAVGKVVDHLIIMAYDFHYQGSFVTGPVAPLSGGGTIYEYDIHTALTEALKILPSHKIILGVPVYGYEWQTIDAGSHAATVPQSGYVASNSRVEKLLSTCASCSAVLDVDAQERFLSQLDSETGLYNQIYYPDATSTLAKVNVAIEKQLGGLAVWALGYEGNTILNPLTQYR